MLSSTSAGERLYILMSVLAAGAAFVSFFVIRSAEDVLLDRILTDCLGDDHSYSRWSFCFNKAYRDSYLPFWQYVLPFSPALFLVCVKWVVGISRPLFLFSRSRLYLVLEGVLVFVGVVLTLWWVYMAVVNDPAIQLNFRMTSRHFFIATTTLGGLFILSTLLNRSREELSYKIVQTSIYIAILGQIAFIALKNFR